MNYNDFFVSHSEKEKSIIDKVNDMLQGSMSYQGLYQNLFTDGTWRW